MADQETEDKLPDGFRVIEYPFHLGDLIGGTAHLTNAQFGGYMRIILAMIHKPDGMTLKELRSYSRITGRYWPEFWELIGNKFVEKDGYISHKRVRDTVHKLARKSAQNRDNVLKRHNSDDTDVLPKDNERLTNHQTNKPYIRSFSNYDVEMFIKDFEMEQLKKEFQGWDMQHYIRAFNEFIVKKQDRPKHPYKALRGFIAKDTKGKTP